MVNGGRWWRMDDGRRGRASGDRDRDTVPPLDSPLIRHILLTRLALASRHTRSPYRTSLSPISTPSPTLSHRGPTLAGDNHPAVQYSRPRSIAHLDITQTQSTVYHHHHHHHHGHLLPHHPLPRAAQSAHPRRQGSSGRVVLSLLQVQGRGRAAPQRRQDHRQGGKHRERLVRRDHLRREDRPRQGRLGRSEGVPRRRRRRRPRPAREPVRDVQAVHQRWVGGWVDV